MQIDAMRDRQVPIAAIHLANGYVLMFGGMTLPITDWYDELGDHTEDIDEVVAIDAGTPEIGYISTPVCRAPQDWNH